MRQHLFKSTSHIRWINGPLLGLLLLGCSNQQSDAATTNTWVHECPGNAFCFARPATLVEQPGQAIDSLAGRYRSNTMTLTFDMGQYGTSLDHLVKPAQEAVTIDGRPAQVLLSEHEIMLIVPKVHKIGSIIVKFNMALQFDGKVSRELALRIFQSIEFKPPH